MIGHAVCVRWGGGGWVGSWVGRRGDYGSVCADWVGVCGVCVCVVCVCGVCVMDASLARRRDYWRGASTCIRFLCVGMDGAVNVGWCGRWLLVLVAAAAVSVCH